MTTLEAAPYSEHDGAELSWLQVCEEERAAIRASLPPGEGRDPGNGLAISGGGIRSATFALGVLQAFAAHGKLSRFDYLSTVSGGGYIGSWLSGLIHRRGGGDVRNIEPLIATPLPPEPTTSAEAAKLFKAVPDRPTTASHEDPSLQWLRRYSNYLTPRLGLFGADTWTAIVTYTRNLTLNWLVLIPIVVGAILLVAALLPAAYEMARCYGHQLVFAGLVILLIVGAMIALGLDPPEKPARELPWWRALAKTDGGVALLIGLPSLLAAWVVALGLARVPTSWLDTAGGYQKLLIWMGAVGAINLAIWGLCGYLRQLTRSLGWAQRPKLPDYDAEGNRPLSLFRLLFPVFVAGLIGGALAYAWASWRHGRVFLGGFATVTDGTVELVGAAYDTYFGTIIVLLMFSHVVLLFIGFAKRRMSESDREWFARLGAWLFLLSFMWLGGVGMLWLGAIAIPSLHALNSVLPATGIAVWALQSIGAVLLGKSAATGAGPQATRKRWLEVALTVGPYVFVAGLIAIIGWTSLWALQQRWTPPASVPVVAAHERVTPRYEVMESVPADGAPRLLIGEVKSPESPRLQALNVATVSSLATLQRVGWGCLIVLGVAALGVGVLLSWRVDINLFSYNRFYANRLVRAYLGASRDRLVQSNFGTPRAAHPFTNLDPDDDLPMSALATFDAQHRATSVQRPLHLINTALNLTAPSELAWQSRKAASFTFSPLHGGYAFPTAPTTAGVTPIDAVEGYRRSYACAMLSEETAPEPGKTGVTYGMAFPTSGAAASPNMGYHSTPSLALLLGLFNVRLGRWFGNPRDDAEAWRKRSPKFSLKALFNELAGNANFKQSWLYLSDGGHFENLGVYELVRRRLPVIVVIDGAQDPDYNFVDLANAMRLIRADFGVDITWDDPHWAPDGIRPVKDSPLSNNAFAFGTVRYPPDAVTSGVASTQPRAGRIIYVKPALLSDAPPDVLEFARRGGGFPQESTEDQWFSEPQFESYRRLGEVIGLRLCRDPRFAAAV